MHYFGVQRALQPNKHEKDVAQTVCSHFGFIPASVNKISLDLFYTPASQSDGHGSKDERMDMAQMITPDREQIVNAVYVALGGKDKQIIKEVAEFKLEKWPPDRELKRPDWFHITHLGKT